MPMNKNGNPNALKEFNASKKEQTEKDVLEAIEYVRKNSNKFTLQAVYDKAGVSRMYFSKHPELMEVVNRYRNVTHKKKQNKDSKDVIITSQKATIAKLEKTIKAFELNENYKEKNEQEKARCEELQKKLDAMISSKIDLNF